MGLRDALRRLRKESKSELIEIPQTDGTVARFSQEDLKAAFLVNVDRLKGEDVEPHPLSVAIQNARHREPWHDSFYDMVEVSDEVEDLSEP